MDSLAVWGRPRARSVQWAWISIAALGVLALAATLAPPPVQALTMDWVLVANPGNTCDPQSQGCFGAVATTYRIGKYEVTNAQYAEFLNAVDPNGTNTRALWNGNMGSSTHGGINFVSGNAAGAKYVVKTSMGAKPVNFVSWYDAVRFANWMHNGMGAGGTETGAYTLLGGTPIPSNGTTVSRNSGAQVWLASENEWYKAAYFNGTTWFDYPAGSNTSTLCTTPTATANRANCNFSVGTVSDVGVYTGSPSPYGTFDQGGNIWEWNETDLVGDGSSRGLRGGGWHLGPSILAASSRNGSFASLENSGIGFRVASVPEPATGVVVMGGVVALAVWRSRRV